MTRPTLLDALSRALNSRLTRRTFTRLKRLFSQSILQGGAIKTGGQTLYVNPRDTVAILPYLLGVYEKNELKVAEKIVKPGDVALDIGASVGYWTLRLSRLVGPGGVVVAFEPDPESFALLKKNIATNSIENVQAYNLALSNRDDRVSLFRSDTNAGDSSLAPGPDEGREAVVVQARRLDSLESTIPKPPAFVKMDVQGHELNVLRGATALLREWRLKTVFLCEFEPSSLRRNGVDPTEFLEFMEGMGYKVVTLQGRGPKDGLDLAEVASEDFKDFETWVGKGANVLFFPPNVSFAMNYLK